MRKGLFFVILALLLLILPLRWIVAMLIAAAVHEMGHIAAVRLLGGKIQRFSLGWEGAILEARLYYRWQILLAVLAGPLAGVTLAVFYRFIPRVAISAAAQTIFNLLPIFPMDGGRLLRYLGIPKRTIVWIECATIACILCVAFVMTVCVKMGFLPLVMACTVTYRVFAEKLLAKRRIFEYNIAYHRK